MRTFHAFTSDLHRMADWLINTGIKAITMESTRVLGRRIRLLESHGLDVILANAREAHTVPGR